MIDQCYIQLSWLFNPGIDEVSYILAGSDYCALRVKIRRHPRSPEAVSDTRGRRDQGTLTTSRESSSPSSLRGSQVGIASVHLTSISPIHQPIHKERGTDHAQIVSGDLDLGLTKQSLGPSDATFHGVKRGVSIVASLVTCFAEEVGVGIGPPANACFGACGDAGCRGDGDLTYERQRDLFPGCG